MLWTTIARVMCHHLMRCAQGAYKVSKQSNETYAQTDDRDPTTRGLTRRDRNRPNRDEFVEAQKHAEEVLGLDEKVSDGLRRALKRFQNSPLTLYMEILNDPEQAWDRRMDAAHRVAPYLHRKLEDKHGTTQQGGNGAGAGAGGGARGPTINLTVNRPAVQINTTERTTPAPAAPEAKPAEEAPKEQARPKAFKKPQGKAK